MDVSCGIGCFVSELRGLVGSWVYFAYGCHSMASLRSVHHDSSLKDVLGRLV